RQRISSQSFKAAMRDNLTLVRTDKSGAVISDTMKDLAERLGLSMSVRSALIGDRRFVPALTSRGFSEEDAKGWSNEVMGLWRAEGAKVESDTPLVIGEKEIAALARRLATAFETGLTDIHLDRLAILAGIHDLGKALKGFQDKLEGTSLTSRGHVAEALAVLMARPDTQKAVQLPLLFQWFESLSDAMYVSICHHGEPVADDRIRAHLAVLDQLLAQTRYGHDPIREVGRLSQFLFDQFPNAREPAPKLRFTSQAQHLFAGMLMASD